MNRTPASIGREIAGHEQAIRDLKAELAETPPATLEVTNCTDDFDITFSRFHTGSLDVRCAAANRNLNVFLPEQAARLRDWLNYYFPKETA